MSTVTDIILTTGIDAQPDVAPLNAQVAGCLKQVDSFAGGSKAMQCDVYLAAINYLDVPAFLDAFKAIEWEEPECVQLLVKQEHDDNFTSHFTTKQK